MVTPNVPRLTIMFTVLFFLAATQDIAVDGWGLTMLKPLNVGFAATCNMLGQQLGRLVGYTVFTTLEAGGVLDTAQFMLLWGVLFLLTTTAIAVFKKEESLSEIQQRTGDGTSQELDLSLLEAYKMLWKIIVSPRMYIIIIIYLTSDFGFSAAEHIYSLKLVEFGFPRERISQLKLPMIPVKLVVTLLMTRYTVGPRPLNVWLASYPVRLICCVGLTVMVCEERNTFQCSVSILGLSHSIGKTGGREFPQLFLHSTDLPLCPPPDHDVHQGRIGDGLQCSDKRPPGWRDLHHAPHEFQ